jgi:hypothetical protein
LSLYPLSASLELFRLRLFGGTALECATGRAELNVEEDSDVLEQRDSFGEPESRHVSPPFAARNSLAIAAYLHKRRARFQAPRESIPIAIGAQILAALRHEFR